MIICEHPLQWVVAKSKLFLNLKVNCDDAAIESNQNFAYIKMQCKGLYMYIYYPIIILTAI